MLCNVDYGVVLCRVCMFVCLFVYLFIFLLIYLLTHSLIYLCMYGTYINFFIYLYDVIFSRWWPSACDVIGSLYVPQLVLIQYLCAFLISVQYVFLPERRPMVNNSRTVVHQQNLNSFLFLGLFMNM